ncbi:MAG TPA: AbrB/MazE/SpoVT family DNA-binding domain-containing protein [Saprospiraceae bacterium]|nr:AbrB/MazE/SpoVT family DNA-binding domain-containing protein [Saprospiraceae bacterium]
MQAQIKKWGNSYGIRLPMNMAKELNLAEGSLLEIEERKGKIILTPVENEISIEVLTQGMTVKGVREQLEDYPALGLEEEL